MPDDRNHPGPSKADIQLFRSLDARLAAALGVEVFIAVGLLAFLGPVSQLAGPAAPLAYLLTAVALLPTVLAYGELSARTPGPGGSYHLVGAVLPGLGTFLTGWVTLLGQTCAGAILVLTAASHLEAVLQAIFPHRFFPPQALMAAILVIVVLVNLRGERIGRRFQGMLVVGAASLLLLLAATSAVRGWSSVAAARFDVSVAGWLIGAGVLVSGLWSIEVIVGLREEIHRPHLNTPRALLIAVAVAGLLGALVAWGAGGWLRAIDYSPRAAAMVEWARELGGSGVWWPTAVSVAFFSVLALNRIVVTVLRQVHVLGQKSYFPPLLARIAPAQRTPVVAVVLLGAALLSLVWWADLLALARLSGVCLLTTGSLVNLAAALGRRDASKPGPFALPLHPFIPLLGIAVNLALLVGFSVASLIACGGWALLGVGFYFAYIRRLRIAVQEGATVFREEGIEAPSARYRVLVAVNDPAEAVVSINLAATLAAQQEGEVVLLQVVQVPDQVNVAAGRRWAQRRLDALGQMAEQVEGVPVRATIRLARDVPRAIIGAVKDEGCHLVVMGWRGPTLAHRVELGPVLGPVLSEAPCNVIVVKGRSVEAIRRVLVPTAGGPHAPLAARLGLSLVEKGGELTLLNVVRSDQEDKAAIEEAQRRIAQAAAELGGGATVTARVDVAPDAVSGIVAAAEEHDLVLLGATEESILDQVLFGRLPEQVASRTRKPVAIVKRYRGLPQTWARKAWQVIYNLFPTLDQTEQAELLTRLRRGARADQNYYILVFLSAIIATLGLLQSSGAVIIGAMLVAPLMTPILSLSLGMVMGDGRTLRVAVESVVRGVLAAVGIATLLTMLLPAVEVTPELLARTRPTLLDLFVALASGAAGAYALGRKEVAAALPGVAIAAALMPPVCTIGVGLALRNPQVAGGAALLFTTNLVSIAVAGALIFLLLGIRPKIHQQRRRMLLQQGLILSLVLLLVISVPLGLLLVRSAQEVWRGWTLESTLRSELGGAEIVRLEHHLEEKSVHVTATVYALQAPTREKIEAVQLLLQEMLDRPVILRLTVVPVAEFTVP